MVDDVVELLAIDAITRLLPRTIANHVKDRTPKTLDEVTNLANEFIRNRGWTYDQTGDVLKQSQEGVLMKQV